MEQSYLTHSLSPSLLLSPQFIPQCCAACDICLRMAVLELASPGSIAYCHSTLFSHFQDSTENDLAFMLYIFKSQDIDTRCFLVMWIVHVFLVFFFSLSLSSFPPLSPSLCCLSRFLLHSPIQTMSESMAARIKATGFSLLMMDCCCLTEAASKIH